MKPQHPLETALAKLACAPVAPPDLKEFQSGVWREIRHREALCAHAEPGPWWTPLQNLRVAALAACLAFLIGVSVGIAQHPAANQPSLASQHLDLAVFSTSASGLPSNALASRK